ncbi:hypothetical protein ACHAXS_007097 [Conticribra weissflogii]
MMHGMRRTARSPILSALNAGLNKTKSAPIVRSICALQAAYPLLPCNHLGNTSKCSHHGQGATILNNTSCPNIQRMQRRYYLSVTHVEMISENVQSGTGLIQPYLRTCLTGTTQTDSLKNEEFAVSFIGTGGGSPGRHRNSSCTALRLGGQTFLFDVGEGTQRQLGFTRIWPLSINKIFITHMHGDHVFGLVPLILEIQVAAKLHLDATRGRTKRPSDGPPTLEIYGPPGLYNYINMGIALTCSKINYLNVKVIELVGGRNERGPKAQGGKRNIFLSHYPEIETPRVRRSYIQRVSVSILLGYSKNEHLSSHSLSFRQCKNEDQVWVIDKPETISRDMLQKGEDGFNRLPNDVNLGKNRRLFIKAAELDHLGGVQTFGYTVEEQTPPRNIDAQKATALGLKPSKKYSLLKMGESVPTDDGTGIVKPEQVLLEELRARKLAVLSDHRRVPPPMAELCRNADLLVHEATLTKEDGIDKIKIRGHNTAENAGIFGGEMGCVVVALNHFASKAISEEVIESLLAEARKENGGKSQIVASYDFMEVWIPRGGFNFNSATSKN